MYTVRLRRLSVTSAERLLAMVWVVLERQGIASPRLLIEGETGARLTIGLSFGTEQEADRLIRAVPMLAPSGPDAAERTEAQSTNPVHC